MAGEVLVFISLDNSQMFYILCLFLNFVKFQNNGMVHFRKFLVSCSHGTTYTRVAKWYNARARSQSAHVGNCTAAPAEIPTVSGWWKLSNYISRSSYIKTFSWKSWCHETKL